jgi:site-specific recombinase XerD
MASYSLEKLLLSFLEEWQYIKKRTPETVRNYELYIRRFLRWSKITKPSQINDSLLKDYKLYLKTLAGRQSKLDKKTINYHLIALRNFLHYLSAHNINLPTTKAIKLTKVTHSRSTLPTTVELTTLLRSVSSSTAPLIIKKRDQALLHLMLETGLKLATIAQLKIDQLKKHRIHYQDRQGEHQVSISAGTIMQIHDYLLLRPQNNPYLFISHDRAVGGREVRKPKPMTTRSVQRVIEKYAHKAGLNLTANDLRRARLSQLYKQGLSEEEIKTTMGYTKRTSIKYLTNN